MTSVHHSHPLLSSFPRKRESTTRQALRAFDQKRFARLRIFGIVLPMVMGYDGGGIALSFRAEEWVLARTRYSRVGGRDRQPPGGWAAGYEGSDEGGLSAPGRTFGPGFRFRAPGGRDARRRRRARGGAGPSRGKVPRVRGGEPSR